MRNQVSRNADRRSNGQRRRVDDGHGVTTVMGLGMALIIVITMILKL